MFESKTQVLELNIFFNMIGSTYFDGLAGTVLPILYL